MLTLPSGTAIFDASDKKGKARFRLATQLDGGATFFASDQDDKLRIALATLPDGSASVFLQDPAGKEVWGEVSYR